MDGQELYNLYEAYLEVVEGKVEWDNPKRPLQSGLTPREKNRAKRISIGIEEPHKSSFGGKTFNLTDKDYERYGKLKMAHDDEKGKKTPRGKRHEFKQIEDIEGTLVGTRGGKRRKWKNHKNLPINSKLWKQDERQKVYDHNDLKESKESYDYYDIILSHLLDEGYAETLEAAEVMMVNMSEEWRDSIMEMKVSKKQQKKDAKTREKWYGEKSIERGTDRFSQLQKKALKSAKTKLF